MSKQLQRAGHIAIADRGFAAEGSHRGRPRASMLSWAFCRAYLTTMRPYLLFVSGITGVLGMALAPTVALGPASILFMAFFLSYGFGQALTDCFQTDTDRLSSPYRPLVRGIIHRRDVMTVSLVGLSAIGAILTTSQLLNLPLVIVSILGLATYTWFKRKWWAGPFYNAWIVAVLMVIGYLSATGLARTAPSWSAGLTGAVLLSFFGYANFVLVGYFKDISADRATGYRTLPVVFGLKLSTTVSDVLAGATVASAIFAMASAGVLRDPFQHPPALLMILLGSGVALVAQMRLHRVRAEAQAHRAISLVVHAYILLLGSVATAFKEAWALPLIIYYAVFFIVLRTRPMKEQI